MIGPLPVELAKRERIVAAAKFAADAATASARLESAVRDGLRFAFADAHLVYFDGECGSIVTECVEAAQKAARQSKTEAEIASVIDEAFSAAIDAHLRKLAKKLPSDDPGQA